MSWLKDFRIQLANKTCTDKSNKSKEGKDEENINIQGSEIVTAEIIINAKENISKGSCSHSETTDTNSKVLNFKKQALLKPAV